MMVRISHGNPRTTAICRRTEMLKLTGRMREEAQGERYLGDPDLPECLGGSLGNQVMKLVLAAVLAWESLERKNAWIGVRVDLDF